MKNIAIVKKFIFWILYVIFHMIVISLKSNNNNLFFLYKKFIEFVINDLIMLIFYIHSKLHDFNGSDCL